MVSKETYHPGGLTQNVNLRFGFAPAAFLLSGHQKPASKAEGKKTNSHNHLNGTGGALKLWAVGVKGAESGAVWRAERVSADASAQPNKPA